MDSPMEGAISIQVNLFPYPPNMEEIYAKELAIIRYLAGLVFTLSKQISVTFARVLMFLQFEP